MHFIEQNILVLIANLLTSGCALNSDVGRISETLSDTAWNVLAYANDEQVVVGVLDGTQINARFDADGRVTGSAGCNDYFAGYQTDDQSITIGHAAATRRFCAEPQGIMEQEAGVLAAMQSVLVFRLDGDEVHLYDADGALTLKLARDE